MCGRYDYHPKDFSDLRIRFDLDGNLRLFKPRFNIAPSQEAPVIMNCEGRSVEMLQWGLVPSWANDASIGNRMINARCETIREKPSFRDLLATRRCLVLAHGFYEWRKDGAKKIPMRFRLKSGNSFAFAGLWDSWRKPDGNFVHSFTIVTTKPNDLMRQIHNRMPVMLNDDDALTWLTDRAEIGHSLTLLKPFPAELMECYQVSTLVNDPRNDSPACIAPATESQARLI
jgi:putative SOS response-associated peptidase YedK